MTAIDSTFKVAAVQAAPVFLNRDATVEKACRLIKSAAEGGARLIVFPEAFIPAYPDWVWTVPAGEQGLLNDLYGQLVDQSVTIPSDITTELCNAARAANAYVVIGVNERNAEASNGSLYNSLLYIDANGKILGKHRKLVPTGGERLVWAQGDGSTLEAYDTELGKLGGLICWENYMPLARYAMYAWGVQLYVAATWDRGGPWTATLRHVAKEGQMYVIGCCQALHKDDLPELDGLKEKYYANAREWINVGDSAIVGPDGQFLVEPVRMREDILYAEVDTRNFRGPKWMFDAAGHYARPDIFQLTVNREQRPMVRVVGDSSDQKERPLPDDGRLWYAYSTNQHHD
uniref:Nitrilase n=1 Tax=uncultured organism TaxID=155900 RepID=Q6RWP6_9ZZZZ|nr:nitrilase [uncultured organism]